MFSHLLCQIKSEKNPVMVEPSFMYFCRLRESELIDTMVDVGVVKRCLEAPRYCDVKCHSAEQGRLHMFITRVARVFL